MVPTITQLEMIGELTSIRVHVTDFLCAEGEGYRGCWLISGDALVTCDVFRATIANIDRAGHTATIRLPRLHVTSARIDHEKTKTWSVEKTSWLPWRCGNQGIVRDAAMYHGQKLIETVSGSEEHLNLAKAQAEMMIRQMYRFIEWNVDIEWQ